MAEFRAWRMAAVEYDTTSILTKAPIYLRGWEDTYLCPVYLNPGGLRYHTEKGICVTKNGDPCSTSLAHEHLVHVLVSIGSAGVTTSEALHPVVASPPVKVPDSVSGLCARPRASRLVRYRARCLTNYPTTVIPFARSSFGVLPSAPALIGFLFFISIDGLGAWVTYDHPCTPCTGAARSSSESDSVKNFGHSNQSMGGLLPYVCLSMLQLASAGAHIDILYPTKADIRL
ncbi:hypothetical protein B0H14DRAFT_3449208 [Mycena olivaceomarginata]|nr:hypothetical protein B0H14DRAFT_3449208 [Mycena olivaceomarginata]